MGVHGVMMTPSSRTMLEQVLFHLAVPALGRLRGVTGDGML